MPEKVNEHRLIMARELRGYTQKQLAEESGVDQAEISRYEGGRVVSERDLRAIATALNFPISFFYREGKRYSMESGEMFHRKRKLVTKTELMPIHAKMNLLRLNAQRLLEVADVDAPYHIPPYDPKVTTPEEIAEAVREAWRIPSGPIANLVEVMERAFCLIYLDNFSTDKIDEAVQWVEPAPPVILMNKAIPGERFRFTLAHVLGHLVMHHHKDPYPDMEDEADQFAGAFLMPPDEFKQDAKGADLNRLVQLKPYWKVSVRAMVYRAHELGIINDVRNRSFNQQMSRDWGRKYEPFELPVEKPSLSKELLDLYQDQLRYSVAELAETVDFDEADFREWYLPAPRLQIVQSRPENKIRKIK